MAPVGPETAKFLRRCGYHEGQIAAFTGETRLFHDMKEHGDNIDDEFRILEREWQVDFSTFPFAKYFPDEVRDDWDHFVLIFLGSTRWAEKVRNKYPPVTLDMIEQTIAHRKWIFD